MEIFDETALLLKLDGMSAWKRVAFMASCCERMLPNYAIFHAQTNYGNYIFLRAALDAIWEWVESEKTTENMLAIAIQSEQQAPDTSEFSSPYTSAALDAATAIATTAEAVSDASASKVIEVAALARDTVDIFVQEADDLDPNDPGLDEKIRRSDLMQAELRAQNKSLDKLRSLPNDDKEQRIQLREHWANSKIGSLPADY